MTDTNEAMRLERAEAWLRACSAWLLSNDLDMKMPSGILDTDPLDIADELAALARRTPSPAPAGEVEQVDREAAARIYQNLRDHDMASWIKSGKADADWIIQAFKNHRLAALASHPSPAIGAVEALEEAIEPVRHWYQSDEEDARPLVNILADIVADLRVDRALALKAKKLLLAGSNLSICAQTTGGTAGSDAGLMLAIEQWSKASNDARAALSRAEAGDA